MEKNLDLQGLKLVAYQYDFMAVPDVSFEYVEHATDYFSGDRETSVDITKEQAEEIIQFLKDVYKL